MIRRPPRSTRTDTRFPYTTLFRSCYNRFAQWRKAGVWDHLMDAITAAHDGAIQMIDSTSVRAHQQAATAKRGVQITVSVDHAARSEERREGKGSVSTCSSRWWPDHKKQQIIQRK